MTRRLFQGQGQFWLKSIWLWALFVAATDAEDHTGILDAPPPQGRYVATSQGYLVPYQEKIPGTDITFEMTPIPAGTFWLGSAAAEPHRQPDEGPQVSVQVSPYWMGVYEVTWREYRPFMELYNVFKNRTPRLDLTDDKRADAFSIPTPLYEPDFTFGLGDDPRQPAVTMSQYAARQYTKWISRATGRFYRLPSECEWEYAARAGTQTAYSFGDDPGSLDEYAWYFDNAEDTYHEVGSKKPSAWGLYDMHGNVAEFTLDEYGAETYRTVKANQPAGVLRWPTKLQGHVIRGGSWDSDPEALRCAARAATADWRTEDPNLPKSPWWFTDEEALCVGFRLMRPLLPPGKEERLRYWDADVDYLRQDVESRISEGRGVYGYVEEAAKGPTENLGEQPARPAAPGRTNDAPLP
jgi:formylglycine-generating enzyme required for sulfatase activity